VRDVRTADFHRLLRDLPGPIRRAARKTFRLFLDDPSHPSLRVHRLRERHDAGIVAGSVSVSVSARYRAIYHVDGDTNVWYWIGTHSDYNRLVGKA